jgi:GNAT superfamily N-acetyltransferase
LTNHAPEVLSSLEHMNSPLKTDTEKGLVIDRVPVEAILDLRHRMLRAGLPPETARFKTDTIENTWHIAASLLLPLEHTGPIVSCASFMFETYNLELAWRLRGMCTDERFKGQGYGSLLLKTAEESILADTPHIRLLWCDARVSAISFYEKQGWIVNSDEFTIHLAGPHKKMYKRIS